MQWFAKKRDLPVSALADLFVIHDTGAHSHSMGFQYNGKLRAPELLLRDKSRVPEGGAEVVVHLIRERETVGNLFSNSHLPKDLAVGVPAAYPYGGSVARDPLGKPLRSVAYAVLAATVASVLWVAGKKAFAAQGK